MSELEQTAIERLRAASDMSLRLFEKPLVITYSGGKDSDVMLYLAEKSGIPVDVFHWWMEDGVLPGQEVLDGFEEDAL